MWDQWSTDTYDGQTAELITIQGCCGDDVHAYVVRPNGDGPYPGIVLVHHLPGWDEFYRETARRLADHGYVVICPNLYERFGHGTPEDVAAKARGEGGVSDDCVLADCEAALGYLEGPLQLLRQGGDHRHLLRRSALLLWWPADPRASSAVVDCWGGNVSMAPESLTEKQPVAPHRLHQGPLVSRPGAFRQRRPEARRRTRWTSWRRP